MTTVVRHDALASMYVIKTHYIFRVLEFHPENQTVDIIQDTLEYTYSPMSDITMENEFGNDVTVTLKKPDVLFNVPVKQFRFGQFEIQACPAPGDTGYIEVFTNDVRNWIMKGKKIQWSDKHFSKNSAVFVPFLPNRKNAVTDYPANEDGSADLNKFVIKSKNTSITINDVLSESENTQATITIATPSNSITLEDNNGEGLVTVKGDLTINGDLSVNGDLGVDGDLSATGDINAEGNVAAKKDVTANNGEISLMKHIHTSAAPGSPTGPAQSAPSV